jgi:hypothetical protein
VEETVSPTKKPRSMARLFRVQLATIAQKALENGFAEPS